MISEPSPVSSVNLEMTTMGESPDALEKLHVTLVNQSACPSAAAFICLSLENLGICTVPLFNKLFTWLTLTEYRDFMESEYTRLTFPEQFIDKFVGELVKLRPLIGSRLV